MERKSEEEKDIRGGADGCFAAATEKQFAPIVQERVHWFFGNSRRTPGGSSYGIT